MSVIIGQMTKSGCVSSNFETNHKLQAIQSFIKLLYYKLFFRFNNSQVSAAHLNFWLEELNQGFFLIRYFQFIVDFDIILG